MPLDLREWVDACTLALWAQDEVEDLNTKWSDPEEVRSQKAELRGQRSVDWSQSRDYEPDTLFRLLTFAYAANVLASEEIAHTCRTEPAFRFLCEGKPPFPQEINSFRRRHRVEIQEILARIFARAIDVRLDGNEPYTRPASWTRLFQTARERLDIARHLDNCE